VPAHLTATGRPGDDHVVTTSMILFLEWEIPVEHPGAPDVPVVHVWMGDEEKTDGQRIPGY
jgi:hypothetical protein